jgi:4-hydroxy-3-polyprenylbenzoate decarboxylase
MEAGHEVHAIFSTWGAKVMLQETGETPEAWLKLRGLSPDRIHASDNLAAPPSSGTFRLNGTIIVPCSMSTLGALSSGAATNLVHRAGSVALKEGRPLILVPREAPLSLVDLRNMTSLAEAGATILPASPGFYHRPTTVDQLVDFVTGKILDRLGVEHRLLEPWNGS